MTKTILLIDDWEQMRDLIQIMLTNMKFRVITASNGREALEMMEVIKPDLILSDVEMPEVDGIAVAKAVLPDIPVILMTGNPEKNRPRLAAEGIDVKHLLRKPFSQMDLLLAICDHLKIG